MTPPAGAPTPLGKWCRCDRNRCEGDGLYRCVAKAVKGEVPCHWSPAGAPEGGDEVDRVMRGYREAYPTDVWPETPFSDAQAASVMRLMVPRIRAALDAAWGADK